MKIAVPTTRENMVDSHFGHCEMYTIYTINEKQQVDKKEILPSPQGCGCKSNIASVLREKGVRVMLAGNMGEGALNVLKSEGIVVIRGCNGITDKVVELYLNNSITDSGETCHNHDHQHECGNH
jgi:predicted Fe-Mo cluster-binding NifX family protein